MITQTAPDPVTLRSLVERLTYKVGWTFNLVDNLDRGQESKGMTLVIALDTTNSYDPKQHFVVNHYMIVPAASFDERSWKRWLFDQILLVEQHEASEFFKIDNSRPFAPNHGPGNDPYAIRELGILEDAQVDHRGVMRHKEV